MAEKTKSQLQDEYFEVFKRLKEIEELDRKFRRGEVPREEHSAALKERSEKVRLLGELQGQIFALME